jgi:amidase
MNQPAMHAQDITALDACALSQALHRRDVSAREVMQAYLQRIDALNPQVNALVGLLPHEGLLQQADERDAMLAQGRSMGWMHGFPMAIKELSAVAGLPLSMGSPLLAGQIAPHDSLVVARMKAAGGIVIGKSNVPEFGLGSHTYNPVFGTTRNAWDRTRSAGGSSGGASVSLALQLQPVADGSDMMGSLRNPAAWANVFGLRPSQGRVPYNPHAGDGYVAQLGTEGPMGRTVRDVAMLLSVQAGRDARQPLSIAQDGSAFAQPLQAQARGLRIGWLGDLGGHLPFEPGILPLCEAALKRFETLGAAVEPTSLGYPCDEVWQTWLTWRRFLVAGTLGPLGADPKKHAQLKPEAQWEYDQGQGLSGPQVYAASLNRTRFYRHMVGLFERFDLLVLPTAQCWPFPAEWTWPRELAGRPMDTYHRWMEVVIYATLTGLPAMSVPAGFSDAGLPMGMQLIGPPLGDLAVLNAAAAYEAAIGDWLARRPDIA